MVAIPHLDMLPADADVAVSFGPRFVQGERSGAASRGVAELLLFEPVFAVAAPALAKRARLRRPADLVRTSPLCPLLRCPQEPWGPWFAAAGMLTSEPTHGLKLVDIGLSVEAAASGQGVALARAGLASRWLTRGELIDLFAVRLPPRDGYSLSVQQASSLALDFAEWLRRECALLEANSCRT